MSDPGAADEVNLLLRQAATHLNDRHDWLGPPALYVLRPSEEDTVPQIAAVPVPEEMWAGADPVSDLLAVADAIRAIGMPPGFHGPAAAWLFAYRSGPARTVAVTGDGGCSYEFTASDQPVDQVRWVDLIALPGQVADALTAVKDAADQ